MKDRPSRNGISVPGDYSNWSHEPTVEDRVKKPVLYTHDGKPLTIGLAKIGFARNPRNGRQ